MYHYVIEFLVSAKERPFSSLYLRPPLDTAWPKLGIVCAPSVVSHFTGIFVCISLNT